MCALTRAALPQESIPPAAFHHYGSMHQHRPVKRGCLRKKHHQEYIQHFSRLMSGTTDTGITFGEGYIASHPVIFSAGLHLQVHDIGAFLFVQPVSFSQYPVHLDQECGCGQVREQTAFSSGRKGHSKGTKDGSNKRHSTLSGIASSNLCSAIQKQLFLIVSIVWFIHPA